MKRPTYPKPDENQAKIKADLKASGFRHKWFDVSSLPISKAGGDAFVLGQSLIYHIPTLVLVEIKQYGESLNKNERELHDEVREMFGAFVPVIVAYCAEDILRWFGALGTSNYGWDEEE